MQLQSQLPFVGRTAEMAVMAEQAESALISRGRVVLISGEAGIGKSRLVNELLSHRSIKPAAIATGLCREIAGAPVYWPWAQIIRQLENDRDIKPAQAFAGIPNPADGSNEFEFHTQLTEQLMRAAACKPLVLVLEDIHWADSSSLR